MASGGGGRIGVRVFLLGLLAGAALGLGAGASPRGAAALDGEEAQALDLINQYRAANGLGALSVNGTLNEVARWMGQDMATNNYFSHTDSLGRDPFVRMGDFGYTYNTWKGENLAAGVPGAQAAFDLWKGSPGHNANMLSPNYTVIGIARVNGPTSTFGWYWATEFGGQGDPPPAPEPPPPPPPPPPPAPPPAPATSAPAPPTAPPITPGSPAGTPAAPLTPSPDSPSPTPAPVVREFSPPRWWQIAQQVKPWWNHLIVVERDDSILRSVSRLAEQILTAKRGRFVEVEGSPQGVPILRVTLSHRLWPDSFA